MCRLRDEVPGIRFDIYFQLSARHWAPVVGAEPVLSRWPGTLCFGVIHLQPHPVDAVMGGGFPELHISIARYVMGSSKMVMSGLVPPELIGWIVLSIE